MKLLRLSSFLIIGIILLPTAIDAYNFILEVDDKESFVMNLDEEEEGEERSGEESEEEIDDYKEFLASSVAYDFSETECKNILICYGENQSSFKGDVPTPPPELV